MPFVNFEDVIENIVDQVFLDKTDEDGVYDWERLPKNFLKMALVSRTFLNPVRCNVYSHLRVEGPERFMLITGQLRFSPHLANLVKRATLSSTCFQRTHIDEGKYGDTPGGWEPRTVSATALSWFLNACPGLTMLDLGSDFMWALSVQDPKTIKLTDISLRGCYRCPPESPVRCTSELRRGWLKQIVAFPRLKELDISDLSIDDGPATNATWGITRNSSVCTGLSICNMNNPTSKRGLSTLLRSMPSLSELVLDGIMPMPQGELKKCLDIPARTLTLLTITEYHSFEGDPQLWEDDTISPLRQLKTLALNGVHITSKILDILPPRLELLRFAGLSATLLPVPVLAAWLRRTPFPLPALKSLSILGELRADGATRGPKASKAQIAELARLCRGLGIEWSYKRHDHEELLAPVGGADFASHDSVSEGRGHSPGVDLAGLTLSQATTTSTPAVSIAAPPSSATPASTTKRIDVWTDGACRGNGQPGAVGAAGVCFREPLAVDGKRHFIRQLPRNPLPTSQRAELTGIIVALELVRDWRNGLEHRPHIVLAVHTDSKYAIGCLRDWIDKWKTNGWQNTRGVEVGNRDLIEKASNLIGDIKTGGEIEFVWIPREQNLEADGLASGACDQASR
ncbi:hypothetical protein GGX14DRAFT_601812 [Mycena pura]|uniref:RNase H type-1 domain-containing protein n=1 Tax=Mycena pura TaxID=153505 RepID=A0AAD6VQ66_9AGAR|nr:hypothetical protein GGX14DRAFT_601812 [Mycena pura]